MQPRARNHMPTRMGPHSEAAPAGACRNMQHRGILRTRDSLRAYTSRRPGTPRETYQDLERTIGCCHIRPKVVSSTWRRGIGRFQVAGATPLRPRYPSLRLTASTCQGATNHSTYHLPTSPQVHLPSRTAHGRLGGWCKVPLAHLQRHAVAWPHWPSPGTETSSPSPALLWFHKVLQGVPTIVY